MESWLSNPPIVRCAKIEPNVSCDVVVNSVGAPLSQSGASNSLSPSSSRSQSPVRQRRRPHRGQQRRSGINLGLSNRILRHGSRFGRSNLQSGSLATRPSHWIFINFFSSRLSSRCVQFHGGVPVGTTSLGRKLDSFHASSSFATVHSTDTQPKSHAQLRDIYQYEGIMYYNRHFISIPGPETARPVLFWPLFGPGRGLVIYFTPAKQVDPGLFTDFRTEGTRCDVPCCTPSSTTCGKHSVAILLLRELSWFFVYSET